MAHPFKFHLPPYSGDRGLTPEQRRAVQCDQAIFSGVPGTGKTTVAIWRIKTKKDDILFTYTRLLSAAIGHLASGHNGIWGTHQWYWRNCGKSNLNDDVDDGTVVNKLLMYKVHLGNVIVDEGQDLDNEFYKGLKRISKRVSIGADDAQQLYEVNISEKYLKEIFPNNESNFLTRNFRNRYKIYNFARQFVPNNPQAHEPNMLQRLQIKNPGGNVEIHITNLPDGTKNLIKNIISNHDNGNIAILLSTTKLVDYYSELLDDINITHSCYHSKIHYKKRREIERNLMNILVTTFKSAKGLEFDTVILPEIEDEPINNEYNEFYVGSTRARDNLYIICEDFPDILKNFDSNTYILKEEKKDDNPLPF